MDCIATQTRIQGGPSFSDPDVTPAEKWAVYSSHPVFHKIIGNLSISVNDALGYHEILTFASGKHDFHPYDIDRINTNALKKALNSMKIFQRASTVKLIHGWAPTYAFLCRQG